jgi:hypothetical protein
MPPPTSTLRAWFDAHEAEDLRAAESLFADGAVVRV